MARPGPPVASWRAGAATPSASAPPRFGHPVAKRSIELHGPSVPIARLSVREVWSVRPPTRRSASAGAGPSGSAWPKRLLSSLLLSVSGARASSGRLGVRASASASASDASAGASVVTRSRSQLPKWRRALQLISRRKWRQLCRSLSPRPVRNGLVLLLALLSLTCWGLLRPGQHALTSAAAAASAGSEGPSIKSCLLWLIGEASRLQPAHTPAPGKMRDLLLLLGSTAIGVPLMRKLGVASKVLAFLAIGIVIGPSGFALISDIHWSETLAEAGIVFFLCEMGLELSFDRLKNMQRDVFGLGLAQFVVTSGVIFLVSQMLGLSKVQAIILGTAFSLSSSAFALQLLDETKERNTLHGRSAFGILLFQDLVVPILLVLLPMLNAGSGTDVISSLKSAGINALLAVGPLLLCGRYLLDPVFSFVAQAKNTVALRALSFFTVLGMCYIFQIFSLSNTLGAFLAGVLLAETAFREQVDAAISPIREDLLGLFFITVGFGIDLNLVLARPMLVLSAMSGLLLCKAVVTMLVVCRISGMTLGNSQHIGLLLCQAGEFSFVMFGIAGEVGAFTPEQVKLLLTVTSVSMACTPFLSRLGRDLSQAMQDPSRAGAAGEGELREKVEKARVVVIGYGRVGNLVTQLLDERFIPWVAFDVDQDVVAEARAKDLPVFEGNLPEALQRTLGDKAAGTFDARKVAVVTTANVQASSAIVMDIRKAFPDLTIIARAMGKKYAQDLDKNWNAVAVVPGLPEDTKMMNLPIGATVLRNLGYSEADAEAAIDDIRREALETEDKGKTKVKGGTMENLIKWYQGEQQRPTQTEPVPGGSDPRSESAPDATF
eukprot:CAMPEP_0115069104 /NCGR_PEP_ID=MMETSP0227-20121206/12371_1 /TAXON_ID=89957 /ORGANISM="Polarella glacialis, Strain CCMP 1383" /LENGTH=832 /DNA_ID=CAMNT_0002455467 /DNA_START=1 /DNA_END=2500 /DNA_ORIENTATION=+